MWSLAHLSGDPTDKLTILVNPAQHGLSTECLLVRLIDGRLATKLQRTSGYLAPSIRSSSTPSMRQRWLSILLVLFLLFGQSAAVVHAVGHLQAHHQTSSCAVPVDIEQCGPAHDVCPTCLALAAIAVAIPVIACWMVAACERRWHFPARFSRHLALAFSPPARSRGPPLLIGMYR